MNTQIAINLLLIALQNTAAIGALIDKVRAEGRDITTEELEALISADAAARKVLQDAIDANPS